MSPWATPRCSVVFTHGKKWRQLRPRQGGAVVPLARRAGGSGLRDERSRSERQHDSPVAAVGDRNRLRRPDRPRCCDVSVSLCVSAPLWFNCDGCDDSNQMRWIRVIRAIRVQNCDGAMTPCLCVSICDGCDGAMAQMKCDVSVPLCVSVPLWFNCDAAMTQIQCDGSVSSAKSASKKCDAFVCDAFVSSCLRGCDVAMVR